MNWRKINKIIHRDLGYFFFGMCIIYSVSGIAINHIDDWDPNYVVEHNNIPFEMDIPDDMDKGLAKQLCSDLLPGQKYKNHYSPSVGVVKIFTKEGSIVVNSKKKVAAIEIVRKRPVFFEMNYLHYNHAKGLWTIFSDLFAIAFAIMAISGLFIVRGKNGLSKRGMWFLLPGLLVPLVILIISI